MRRRTFSTASHAVLDAPLPVSGWTHFTGFYRAGKPSLYVNGRLAREGLASGSIMHPGIGSPPPAPQTVYQFDGLESLLRSSGRPSQPSNGLACYFEGNATRPELVSEALSPEAAARLASRRIPSPRDRPDA